MEASPEEILARLEAYRDSLLSARRAAAPLAHTVGPDPAHAAGHPVTAGPRVAIAPTVVIEAPTVAWEPRACETGEHETGEWEAGEWNPAGPAPGTRHAGLNAVEATVFGQLLATLAGVLGILAFERLAASLAVVAVVAMAVCGAAAATRRVPLAVWWTMGAVLGGAIGRWS